MGLFSRFADTSGELPAATGGLRPASPAATGSEVNGGGQPVGAAASCGPPRAARDVCIPTLSLSPGTRLAQPVRRADGVVLMSAGSVIDADQLRRLIQRHVEFVHVMQEETRDRAQVERDVASAVARVTHLFRGDGSDARTGLRAAITAYRKQAAS